MSFVSKSNSTTCPNAAQNTQPRNCKKLQNVHTRVSKLAVFPQLEPFAKRPKRVGFAKFQMPYGSFFNAVHKSAVGFRFRQNSFFAILFLDPRILQQFAKREPASL